MPKNSYCSGKSICSCVKVLSLNSTNSSTAYLTINVHKSFPPDASGYRLSRTRREIKIITSTASVCAEKTAIAEKIPTAMDPTASLIITPRHALVSTKKSTTRIKRNIATNIAFNRTTSTATITNSTLFCAREEIKPDLSERKN